MVQAINAAVRLPPLWLVYAAGLLPAAWVWHLGLTGGLGPEPIRALERELGLTGLQFLVAVLAVTPLRRHTGINLMRFRRALGLLCFFYVAQHLGVWLFLDLADPRLIAADITKRPYVLVGLLGFLVLLPLALTSTDRAVRRLGAERWRQLHRLTYGAALLGLAHFAMLVKGFPVEPLAYAVLVAALLGLRALPPRRART
ncbi:MAG: protein-methionine-sulfoxide reductase heme-binding subunit MsrQ [Rhodobacteraceae bacterium]|nr:protein-methionine-sulfoxide reductase heme-binding subunit MsrQ [Paracoccaceae bacterium]